MTYIDVAIDDKHPEVLEILGLEARINRALLEVEGSLENIQHVCRASKRDRRHMQLFTTATRGVVPGLAAATVLVGPTQAATAGLLLFAPAALIKASESYLQAMDRKTNLIKQMLSTTETEEAKHQMQAPGNESMSPQLQQALHNHGEVCRNADIVISRATKQMREAALRLGMWIESEALPEYETVAKEAVDLEPPERYLELARIALERVEVDRFVAASRTGLEVLELTPGMGL